MQSVTIEVRKLSELKHPERNARMHPDKQIHELVRSVDDFDLTRLPVIDEEGTIWIGNGLCQALKEMGKTEVHCIVKRGMSKRELEKMMYADNRIFDLGVDDMSAFEDFVASLDDDDLDVPGYEEELLRSMRASAEEIDDILSEYGVIPDERKEQIRAAGETYRQEAEQREKAPEAKVEPETEEGGSFIICPRCGEKIWL